MPPKPIPLPLGIGIDIVHVPRVINLLKDETKINQWSRKVFSRLEWPHLFERFSLAQRTPMDGYSPPNSPRLALPYVWKKENLKGPLNVFKLGQFLAGRLSSQVIFTAQSPS